VTISAVTGFNTVLATLADGTRIAASGPLGGGGEAAVYASLSSGKGSIVGSLNIVPGTNAPANNTLNGTATWLKPATALSSQATTYADGFGPATLSLFGGRYSGITSGGRVMGLPASVSNAKISFSKGGLEAASLEFSRSATAINPSSTGVVNRVTVAAGTVSVVMPVINSSTGAFSGSAIVPATPSAAARSATFQGQLVNNGTITKGYGFFLLPQIPTGSQTPATAPKLSGKVVFEAQSP
jgi:hypothetical protein